MSPLRRLREAVTGLATSPAEPQTDPLPQREPGEALAELAEAGQRIDALEGAEMYEAERAQLYERKSIELDALVAATARERDDLSARSLPLLPGTVYAAAEESAGTPIFDELVERLDFDPTGFVEAE